MEKIAIVGAGLTGLSCALLLQEDFDVTLIEKSRGVSGRAASRTHNNLSFDHGAQAFEMGSEVVERFIRGLEIDGLLEIEKPIWTFDIMGMLQPGDPLKNAKAKWSVDGGIKHLGKGIEKKLHCLILKEHKLEYLQRKGNKWCLCTADTEFEDFDKVLFTIPGPQASRIIERSGMDRSWRDWLAIKLRAASYRSILSFAFSWDEKLFEEASYSALINSDRMHQVTWIGLEHQKPGRTDGNSSLLVCQMSPDWSTLHFRKSIEQVKEDVLSFISEIVGFDLPEPIYSNRQGWLYAIPDSVIDRDELAPLHSEGLFFAGDSFVGGRIHLAMEDGINMAKFLKGKAN